MEALPRLLWRPPRDESAQWPCQNRSLDGGKSSHGQGRLQAGLGKLLVVSLHPLSLVNLWVEKKTEIANS